jgi:hypothetical protein
MAAISTPVSLEAIVDRLGMQEARFVGTQEHERVSSLLKQETN